MRRIKLSTEAVLAAAEALDAANRGVAYVPTAEEADGFVEAHAVFARMRISIKRERLDRKLEVS